ncbi:Protein kinase C signaling pathway involved MAPKK protein [Nowakowskiella sp. JEL0407]|nr:Protein kinase C signaling pathway involved MAPKK protein [Nowakowskiella sp. JEL0407]
MDNSDPWREECIVGIGMELMDCNLHQFIYEREEYSRISHSNLLNMSIHLLEGVEYIHKVGIIHNDIKPPNILVKGTNLKICEFGLAGIKSEKTCFLRQGTIDYMSPEKLMIENNDISGDVWSTGVGKQYPFTKEGEEEFPEEILFDSLCFKLRVSREELYRLIKRFEAMEGFDWQFRGEYLTDVWWWIGDQHELDDLPSLYDCNETNTKKIPSDILSLIQSALIFDPEKRISISELLAAAKLLICHDECENEVTSDETEVSHESLDAKNNSKPEILSDTTQNDLDEGWPEEQTDANNPEDLDEAPLSDEELWLRTRKICRNG